jgi:hypothetical protein
MNKLVVTFDHDDFDILTVKYEIEYGDIIARFDPNHPSMTAFEIEYKWNMINEENLNSGIITMFVLSICVIIGLIISVINTYYDSSIISKNSLDNSSNKGGKFSSRER